MPHTHTRDCHGGSAHQSSHHGRHPLRNGSFGTGTLAEGSLGYEYDARFSTLSLANFLVKPAPLPAELPLVSQMKLCLGFAG